MSRKFRIHDFVKRKASGHKMTAVTCYDATFARLVNRSPVDLVLVGDSLGNVVLGHGTTVGVRLEHMLMLGAAVSAQISNAHLCVDMPFMSYKISDAETLRAATRLVQEGGAESVKIEGYYPRTTELLARAEIPVLGHLGFTPQSVHKLGGCRVQGRDRAAAQLLSEQALSLAQAGASALVLEMIPPDVAAAVTAAVPIPTIGIGAGSSCDGQILVLHDLLGLSLDFTPKFVKHYADLGERTVAALTRYCSDVVAGEFPCHHHTYLSEERRTPP